jgi:hypothetical protein
MQKHTFVIEGSPAEDCKVVMTWDTGLVKLIILNNGHEHVFRVRNLDDNFLSYTTKMHYIYDIDGSHSELTWSGNDHCKITYTGTASMTVTKHGKWRYFTCNDNIVL